MVQSLNRISISSSGSHAVHSDGILMATHRTGVWPMQCPRCQSNTVVKNGSIHNGKPKFMCKACRRQFVRDPQSNAIPAATIVLIDRLLLERISLAGIVRVMHVSARWLQTSVNQKYRDIPRTVTVTPKKRRLTLECDELWSFVNTKQNKQWIWLAVDRDMREIVGVAIGVRDEATAQQLWDSLPSVYGQCAVCYSDFWTAYACVLPSKRHRPSKKGSGQTNHIERLNTTFRQRISRLVRKTRSFSKKIEKHSGAIWYFVHQYNETRTKNRMVSLPCV